MISTIGYKNFKSLKDVSLNMGLLTVITGMNGVGKSSVIQGLLLLRQSYLKHNFSYGVSLDGELTGNLGSVRDIESVDSDAGFIEISVDNLTCRFSTVEGSDDTVLRLDKKVKGAYKSSLFSPNKFQYISASRISPESSFKKDTYSIENRQFGKNGEYAIAYIAELRNNKPSDKKKAIVNIALDEFGDALPFENQINYWLNCIAKNVRLNIVKSTTTRYELNFEMFNGVSWDTHLASNSAFGLTYALPVITALLAAERGDIVIIENPESDLHPQAQSNLGELIARCANEGVQVIIETHSDHILNGIRVAVSRSQPIIESEKVKIFYFFKDSNSTSSLVKDIAIDRYGRMPIKTLKIDGVTGFFDQIDTDYKKIFNSLNAKS